jgi:hypothetical protein
MPYFTLIVKGLPDVATLAANRHNLTVEVLREAYNFTVLRVDESPSAEEAIHKWYHDRRAVAHDYGFPDGTCMLFTKHKE